jgi:ferrous iron transport protein A
MHKLSEIKNGEQVRITNFEGGQGVLVRLKRFGIYPGDTIRVLRRAPFGGPVLLEVRGMEIALGHGIASRILVEVLACDSP